VCNNDLHNRLSALLAIALFPCFLGASVIALAQTQRTEHTFELDDPDDRPTATLDDVSWLVGSWSGEAFGSRFEESWNPPSAGSMIGFFKLLSEDQVAFYELLLLVEEEDSLSLKVKHFNADFTAWEEKGDYVTFRFIKAEENAVHFSGISFYRIDDNALHAYLVLHSDGNVREEKLVYKRQ
jgi:hypothetical protein